MLRCGRRMLVVASKKPFEAVIDIVKGIIGTGAQCCRCQQHAKEQDAVDVHVLGSPYPWDSTDR